MGKKRYNVFFPRKYEDRDGKEKTEFLKVGVAWPMAERDGFSIELFMPLRAGDLVAFVHEPKDEQGERR